MHDPRVGRFFAVDPLTAKYPHYSPYSFSGNKVINSAELEGLEDILKTAIGSPREASFLEASQPDAAITNSIISIANFTNRSIARWRGQPTYYRAVLYVQDYATTHGVVRYYGIVYKLASTEKNILLDVLDLADPIITVATAGRGSSTTVAKGAGLFTKVVPKGTLAKNAVSSIRKIIRGKWGKLNSYGGKLQTAMEHIQEGHFINSRKGKETSRFSQKNSTISRVKELTNEAISKGTHGGTSSNYSVIYTFKDVIGTTMKGKNTKTLQVFLDVEGNVLNSYPIAKPK